MGNSQSTLTVRDLHNYKGVTYEIIRNTHYTIFIMTFATKSEPIFLFCRMISCVSQQLEQKKTKKSCARCFPS